MNYLARVAHMNLDKPWRDPREEPLNAATPAPAPGEDHGEPPISEGVAASTSTERAP